MNHFSIFATVAAGLIGLSAIGLAKADEVVAPWGEPDLQGIWTAEFDTPLQRSAKYANQEFFTAVQRVATLLDPAAVLLLLAPNRLRHDLLDRLQQTFRVWRLLPRNEDFSQNLFDLTPGSKPSRPLFLERNFRSRAGSMLRCYFCDALLCAPRRPRGPR
jgi:hypothetical protein